MNVWITKYALTKGIFQLEANPCIGFSGMIEAAHAQYPTIYHEPDWRSTREEAVARAGEMRRKKIESLKKQISRLENLKFE